MKCPVMTADKASLCVIRAAEHRTGGGSTAHWVSHFTDCFVSTRLTCLTQSLPPLPLPTRHKQSTGMRHIKARFLYFDIL